MYRNKRINQIQITPFQRDCVALVGATPDVEFSTTTTLEGGVVDATIFLKFPSTNELEQRLRECPECLLAQAGSCLAKRVQTIDEMSIRRFFPTPASGPVPA